MSEERLQEIKDSVDFQKQILMAHNMETLCVDEEQELIEEIERLNNDIKELLKENGNKEKVIKAQDNIINELEKYCNEEIEDYDKHINSKFITDIAREQYEGEKVCFEDMLGKLQELKGSGKK